MKKIKRTSVLFIFTAALALIQFWSSEALAQSSYFTSRGCVNCHSAPVVATCNGCHYHGASGLRGATNKTSYAPGETVSVTISAGSRTGWVRAILYDQNNNQLAMSSGNASGMGSSATLPTVLSAPAPTAPGTYTWKAAWYGNTANNGSTHGQVTANTNSFTVTAPADTAAPVVSAFALPASSTSLTVPVSTLTAMDNVGVTGYMVTASSTAPAASAAGWTAAAPSSVTASAAGNATFYAWAKDAAGNVSASRSARVTITLPDTAAPVVGAFALPASSTSLTVPVSTLTATDNVGVAGYLITTSSAVPAAGAAGWTAAAPTSVTASAAGDVTFYAWAKDTAGNVSASRSASVAITISSADTSKPSLTVSALANGSLTNKVTLNVSGSATDANGIQSVTVNGQAVTLNPDGSFSTALILTAGVNTVTVTATDNAGNQEVNTRTVTYDPNAPVLTVSAPADNSRTSQSLATVTGTLGEASTVMVEVNGGTAQYASISDSTFSANVYLVSGLNTIDITATDLAGNVASAKRTVTYDAVTSLTLAVTTPSQDVTTRYPYLTLKGTVSGAQGAVTVRITMDGRTYTPRVYKGVFQQRLKFNAAKQYVVTVTAKDAAGNRSTVIRNVIYRPSRDDDDRDDD